MECRKITLLFLLINTLCFGQEICDNAIDDDGNGLIDINDSTCQCNADSNNNTQAGLIPNANFENYSQCPEEPSQLEHATGWTQCTMATADYMNSCGYVFEAVSTAGLTPFVQGNGVAGAIISTDFKEYIGTNLTSPINAGKSYSLTFNIASLPVNGDGETCNNGNINYSPLNITLYGSASAGNFPLNTTGSPVTGSQWVVLGSAIYNPVSAWGTLTITFTSTVNVNSIMIGAPEELPESYDNSSCYPYFLFDNLSVTEASQVTASITPTGAFCTDDMVLHANTNINDVAHTSYQWYKEGIAIIGATAANLPVPADVANIGTYAVKITTDNNCIISTNYSVIQYISQPIVTVQPDCTNGTATIAVTSAADQYSFDNGTTWTANNVSPSLVAGSYQVKIKSAAGCESQAVTVSIDPSIVPVPATEDTIYLCQYSESQPLSANSENLLWYTIPTGGTGSTVAPKPMTDKAGTQVYYVSQVINGCESPRVPMTVIINPAPEIPETEQEVAYYLNDVAETLYAYGENIRWFDAAGIELYIAPTPQTTRAGITKYYVSQTVNGCESAKAEILVQVMSKQIVIDYPKFFTPNGDGVHEQWNIMPLADNVKADVYIYDRNGQFIKQLEPHKAGWDGTLNGQNLPSNDYWFRVVYTEYGVQKEYMSHFSLVR